MTFTYDLSTTNGKVRFEIGDTVQASAMLTDEEIAYALGENGSSVLVTAASLCETLAMKFARDVDFSMDGQSVSASQKSKQYLALAATLRRRAGQGVGTIVTTKIDGYSDTTQTPPNATDRRTRRYRDNFDVGRFE